MKNLFFDNFCKFFKVKKIFSQFFSHIIYFLIKFYNLKFIYLKNFDVQNKFFSFNGLKFFFNFMKKIIKLHIKLGYSKLKIYLNYFTY